MSKQELEELMNDSLPFAKQMLEEHGEFHPYGGAIKANGEIIRSGAYNGEELPLAQELIDVLVEASRKLAAAGEYRATAIIFDVLVKPPNSDQKTDAIQINLDHANGLSIEVFLPYRLSAEGDVDYGEMFAQKGAGRIF